MGAFNARGGGKLDGNGTKMVGIKGITPELHRRMRLAAAEEGCSYAQLIERLLDRRDSAARRRAGQQLSPLHRPPPENLDPEAVGL